MRTTMRLRAAAALLSSSMESRPDQCLQPSRDERGLGLAKAGLAQGDQVLWGFVF